MAGRSSRVRRHAFLLSLLVSAALYAYSLAGIAGTEGQLRSAVSAQVRERSTPVSYQPASQADYDCPDRAGTGSPAYRL
jgi:hypothetical protein